MRGGCRFESVYSPVQCCQVLCSAGRSSCWQTVTWNGNWRAIHQFSRTATQVILHCCPEAKQYPGQVVKPIWANQSGFKCLLEATVHSLHQAICLRVISSCGREADAQELRHSCPQGRGELCTTIRRHLKWRPKACNPVVLQGGAQRCCACVWYWYCFRPSCVAVDDGEQVCASTGWRQRAYDVDVDVLETCRWHGDELCWCSYMAEDL